MDVLVSICIPTYKQPALLDRCLRSVLVQTHKQVEVLVSDDTPDDSVKIIVDGFSYQLNITYKKNKQPLGSPANWNAALQMAKGDCVLLLHHDDAFASKESLEFFLQPFRQNPSVDFVFARNPTIDAISHGKPFESSFFLPFYHHPELLLIGNCIGAPSNVLLKASAVEPYHPKYKWIVDIEFYVRLFRKKRRFFYIDQKLIDIGLHEAQISNEVANNHAVLLFENIHYAAENNLKIQEVRLYDFYWRLLRNAKVRHLKDLKKAGLNEKDVPLFVRNMIFLQRRLPSSWLRNGAVSKLLMAVGYSFYRAAEVLVQKR